MECAAVWAVWGAGRGRARVPTGPAIQPNQQHTTGILKGVCGCLGGVAGGGGRGGRPGPAAEAAEPSVEDAYLLMLGHRAGTLEEAA